MYFTAVSGSPFPLQSKPNSVVIGVGPSQLIEILVGPGEKGSNSGLRSCFLLPKLLSLADWDQEGKQ